MFYRVCAVSAMLRSSLWAGTTGSSLTRLAGFSVSQDLDVERNLYNNLIFLFWTQKSSHRERSWMSLKKILVLVWTSDTTSRSSPPQERAFLLTWKAAFKLLKGRLFSLLGSLIFFWTMTLSFFRTATLLNPCHIKRLIRPLIYSRCLVNYSSRWHCWCEPSMILPCCVDVFEFSRLLFLIYALKGIQGSLVLFNAINQAPEINFGHIIFRKDAILKGWMNDRVDIESLNHLPALYM